MEIFFNNIFGKAHQFEFYHTHISAKVETHEEEWALAHGWLLHNDVWFQSRSTRLDLKKYQNQSTWPTELTFDVQTIDHSTELLLQDVYNQYMEYKKFTDKFDPFAWEKSRAKYGVVKQNSNFIAFTKFVHYNNGLESNLFAWNYKNPKLRLGIKIFDKEIEYARSLELDYLYIGSGYEVSSIYKCKFPGFEWWTGQEWSIDIKKFIDLCNQDSIIHTISDLATVQKDARINP